MIHNLKGCCPLHLLIANFRLAVREDIPYVRAIRIVPAAMKHKLPAEYFEALDTTVRILVGVERISNIMYSQS